MNKVISPRHARAEIYYERPHSKIAVDDAWWYTPMKPSDGQGYVYLNLRTDKGVVCISIKLLSAPSRVGRCYRAALASPPPPDPEATP